MDRIRARQKFHAQRGQAKRRGIEWQLTFEQWFQWWGEDLDKRGPRAWQLSMQRVGDAGPYALGNIRKGTPKDNGRTRSAVYQNTNTTTTWASWPVRDLDEPDPEDESISDYMSRDHDDIECRRSKWNQLHR